jgi:hypothetical protein
VREIPRKIEEMAPPRLSRRARHDLSVPDARFAEVARRVRIGKAWNLASATDLQPRNDLLIRS